MLTSLSATLDIQSSLLLSTDGLSVFRQLLVRYFMQMRGFDTARGGEYCAATSPAAIIFFSILGSSFVSVVAGWWLVLRVSGNLFPLISS